MPSGHSAVLNGAYGSQDLQEAPIEGWRAILSIVLKSRKRPFYGPNRSVTSVGPAGGANGSTESFVNVDEMDVDRVEAMVEGVKKRGVSF